MADLIQLNKVFGNWAKGKKKEFHLENLEVAFQNYNIVFRSCSDRLTDYRQAEVFTHFFYAPERFYLNAKKDICFNYEKKTIELSPDVIRSMFGLPQSLQPDIIQLIGWLKEILRLRREVGDVWTYYKFKQRVGMSVFDDPNIFYLFDNNLTIKLANDVFILNENNYNSIFKKISNLPSPNRKEFRAISKMIKGSIQKDFTHNILVAQKSLKVELMEEIVIDLIKNGYENIEKFSDSGADIGSEEEQSKVRIIDEYGVPISQKSVLSANKEILKNINFVVPKGALDALTSITDGDMQVIDQLAVLIACTILEKKGIKKMFGIAAKDASGICKFLDDIFGNQFLTINNPKDIKKAACISALIKEKYYGMLVYLIGSSKTLRDLDEEYFSRLEKLKKPSNLKIDDSKFGNLNYLNHAMWVAFIKQSRELERYKEVLGDSFEIIYLNSNSEEAENRSLDKADIAWILTIFASYGLTLLVDRKKTRSTYNSTRVVEDFVNCCCVVSPDVDCYSNDLYMAFQDYFKQNYSLVPIKQTQFENLVKFKYVTKSIRPRHNAKDYRRGLRGIAVDTAKIDEYLSSSTEATVKRQSVAEYLQVINEKMIKLLNFNQQEVK